MSKIDKLTEIAGKLTDDQVEGLIHYAQTLLDAPFLERAPPEAIESLKRGIKDDEEGRLVDGSVVFKELERKLKGPM